MPSNNASLDILSLHTRIHIILYLHVSTSANMLQVLNGIILRVEETVVSHKDKELEVRNLEMSHGYGLVPNEVG